MCLLSLQAEHDLRLVASANMVGATVGAVMTALVEGPLELFRHQAQAGLISGNLFKEMGNVVRTQVGPRKGVWVRECVLVGGRVLMQVRSCGCPGRWARWYARRAGRRTRKVRVSKALRVYVNR